MGGHTSSTAVQAFASGTSPAECEVSLTASSSAASCDGDCSFQNRVNMTNLPRRPAAGCQGGHCSTRFTSNRGKNYGKVDTGWRDHLVLLRTVYCGRHLEAALTAHRIPYVLVGGTSIWAAAHVKDLLQTVRASLNHLDELAWMRYLQLWPGVGERTASALIDDMAKADTFSNALSRLRTNARKVSRLVDCISETAEYHGDPKRCLTVAAQYIAPIMETRFGDWVSRRPDFDLLIGLAGHHASLLGFLETYTLDPLSDPKGDSGRNEDRVTLSTVHSAKGTEADCCYVVQVQPGNYPYFLSVGNEQQEEEERRVLYVAITRARDDLIMTRSLEFGIGRIPRITPERECW